MHVLYIVGQNAGGLPHYTAELANAVAKHADVTVMKPIQTSADGMFDDEVELVNAFESLGISMPKLYSLEVDPFEFLRGVLSYDSIKQIRDIGADVIHDTTGLFPQVKLFARRHDIDEMGSFVVTHHEVPSKRFTFDRPAVSAEELLNVVLPDIRTDRAIVHSEKQKQTLIERGEDPAKLRVIPHGAYSVFGSHEEVDRPPIPNNLLFFGNIVPPKGIDTLIEAIPLVKREIPDVTLTIAGDGQIPKRSKKIIEAHQENFDVHNYFIPNEEVKNFYARAEVVVLPYRDQGGTKGHSGALSTAFSFGKPVVTSTAGEFPSQVRDGECGLVVPPEEPEQLAKAIVRILGDEETKREMRKNSLRMAERLSWDSIAEQHVNVYEDLLQYAKPIL